MKLQPEIPVPGPNRPSQRVSKVNASVRAVTLNGLTTAALEHEINSANDQLQPQSDIQPAREPRRAVPRSLNEAQENLLIQWISRVKELSSLPTKPHLTKSATQILNCDGGNDTVSPAWINGFIKRLPDDLKPIKAPSIKKRRIDASDQENLEHWFERLEALIAEVSPANIYNFNETVFQIGDGMKAIWVIGSSAGPDHYRTTRLYCEWMSTIECIAADGWAADPCIVVQGEHIYEHWLDCAGDHGDALLCPSPGGRVTENIACAWIKFFHGKTQDRVTAGQPRLLLFMGQPQYLSFNFLQFCDQHRIILFRFPPNIGHLMQPFDCTAFNSYKDKWNSLGPWMQYDEADDEKDDFFTYLPEAREKVFEPQTIKDAFAERGIFPFDPPKIGQPL
jgi:hypothetical protein